MGYLIAYLLLTLAIGLLRELVNPAPGDGNAATVRRRLWHDSEFDCYSAQVSPDLPRPHSFSQRHCWLSVPIRKTKGRPNTDSPLQRPA